MMFTIKIHMNRRNLLKSIGVTCLGIIAWPFTLLEEKRSYICNSLEFSFDDEYLYWKYSNEIEDILLISPIIQNHKEKYSKLYLVTDNGLRKTKNFRTNPLPTVQKTPDLKGRGFEFHYPIKVEFEV